MQQAMRLSPRDPSIGVWHNFMAEAELGLGQFDAAIDEGNKAIDAGYRVFLPYTIWPPRTRSKATSTRRRPRWPRLAASIPTHRQIDDRALGESSDAFEGLRKAGLPEE